MFELKVVDVHKLHDLVLVTGVLTGETRVGDTLVDDEGNEFLIESVAMDNSLLLKHPIQITYVFDGTRYTPDNFRNKTLRRK